MIFADVKGKKPLKKLGLRSKSKEWRGRLMEPI